MPQKTYPVVEFLGDGISEELSRAVRGILAVLPCEIALHPVDLSLGNREARGAKLFSEAHEAIRTHGVALKYPTTTVTESPNKILRDLCDFSVIHRPVASIPGIPTLWTGQLDLDVVRVATGGTYEDAGRRIGKHSAVSIRTMQWTPCTHAARYAFRLANRKGASVTSSSKFTIQKAADGLFEEAVAKVAKEYPGVPHRRELFDALLGRIVMQPADYRVVVTPNEYGDFLSDSACGLIGSIGLGDSSSFAFNDDGEVTLALFDPAGGTAPDIAGKNLCNPTAMFFALSSMLLHLGEIDAGKKLKAMTLAAIAEGVSTRDIGGQLSTSEFTSQIAERLASALKSPKSGK